MNKKKINSPLLLLALALVFYTTGFFFVKPMDIDSLKEAGIATQEEYTYIDQDGEEHEDETLITINKIGKILTYKDIYLASVPMLLIAMVIGAVLFGSGMKTTSNDSLRHIIFANCVLGVLLIWLTSKGTIISTLSFWLGIISAYFALNSSSKT